MGACFFDNFVLIKGNANDAFNQAVEEEEHYNGDQDGYSGDIQTVHGFSFAKGAPRFGTKAFENWMIKKSEKMDKRECLCIEITGAELKRRKESRGLKGKKGYRSFYFFGWGAE